MIKKTPTIFLVSPGPAGNLLETLRDPQTHDWEYTFILLSYVTVYNIIFNSVFSLYKICGYLDGCPVYKSKTTCLFQRWSCSYGPGTYQTYHWSSLLQKLSFLICWNISSLPISVYNFLLLYSASYEKLKSLYIVFNINSCCH